MKIPQAILDAVPARDQEAALVIYDGECPFCSAYVKHYRLRKAVGRLQLIDARSSDGLIEALREHSIDPNEGMVFVLNGTLHHGADAINVMAMLSSASGSFNRLNAWAFGNSTVASALYPVLRAGRALTLKLLGRKMI